MSYPRQVQFNPGEQILSADFNNLQGFAGQELSDLIGRLLGQDFDAGALTGVTAGLGTLNAGVLTGLNVAPLGTPSATSCVVQPGLGFSVNTSPPALGVGEAAFQSPYRWIRVDGSNASTVGTLTGFSAPGSGVNVYLIQAIDGVQKQSGQSRNVWVVTSNSVVSQSLTKEVDPTLPTINYTSGTSLASPPPITSGYTPLGLVVLAPAGTIGNGQIYDLRYKLVPKSRYLHGIQSGFDLQWVTTDKLQLSAGTAYVYGQPVTFSAFSLGSTINFNVGGTSGSLPLRFDSTISPATGPLAANTNYYCYIVPSGTDNFGNIVPAAPVGDNPDDPTQFALVISPTAPAPDGGPSALFTVAATTTRPQFTVSQAGGLFVGSIQSDGSGYIIPFRRIGNEVIAVYLQAASGGYDTGLGLETFNYTSGGGTFQVHQFEFGPGAATATLASIPASAKAMIVDCNVAYTGFVGTAAQQSIYFLDPTSITGSTNKQVQAMIAGAAASATPGPYTIYSRLTLAQLVESGYVAVNVQMDVPPADGTVAVQLRLAGYVEDVRHPNVT